MCGIAGQWNFESPLELSEIEQMIRPLERRGPDASGCMLFNDDKIALGHTRLSILDLRKNGDQPLTNEDGTVWLTFNGEIYNYRELRRELQSAGHYFQSNTDSEVIVHSYEEWGFDCVQRLNGSIFTAATAGP